VVYRALPRQTSATAWITPSAGNGLLSILGVMADDRRGVLWVCSVPAPNRFLLAENAAGNIDEVDIEGSQAKVAVLKAGLKTPTSAIRVKNTIYAVERKFEYVRNPALKGQDPGAFTVLALPLPSPAMPGR
jgi:hypothetical protein